MSHNAEANAAEVPLCGVFLCVRVREIRAFVHFTRILLAYFHVTWYDYTNLCVRKDLS